MDNFLGAPGTTALSSGGVQVGPTSVIGNSTFGVRVFDLALANTGGSIGLYAGTGTSPNVANPLMFVDKNNVYIHTDVGYRFQGGCFAFGGTGVVNWILEQ